MAKALRIGLAATMVISLASPLLPDFQVLLRELHDACYARKLADIIL